VQPPQREELRFDLNFNPVGSDLKTAVRNLKYNLPQRCRQELNYNIMEKIFMTVILVPEGQESTWPVIAQSQLNRDGIRNSLHLYQRPSRSKKELYFFNERPIGLLDQCYGLE